MNASLLLKNIIRWVLLMFLQVFLLRNISFYNLSTPFIYILFILLLPFSLPNFFLFLLAFLTGLTLDAFYDTLGVHATACVSLAFVRVSFINLSLNRESLDELEPSLGNMGFKWFAIYALLCVLAHHMVVFFLEAFKFTDFGYTLGRSLISVLLSMFTILLASFIFHHKKSG